MSILDAISVAHMNARKARNTLVANLLGTVRSECENKAKMSSSGALSEAEVISIIRSFINKNTETLEKLTSVNNREDAMQKLTDEIEHLKQYLPQQLTDEEIHDIIISLNGKGMGEIMTHFKNEFAGRYDPKKVGQLAKNAVGRT